ncbi:EthD domain-containing protein [Teredinibacter franksiae]|uniref:EthD domain-containing protein n=1 Tax=Teredinibacter franksiae TaxID=2761453 RepID=UPI001628E40E|nr:EthD domain-containing protein [Teredinibacter franksiae]
MIKLIMCLKRREDISREEFQSYWRDKHGPFFMENAHVMGSKKYVQSHTLSSPLNDGMRASRGMQDAYDGVAEVWFESEEQLMAAMGSSEMAELGPKLVADENNFIDHSKSSAFIVEEVEF